VALAVLAVASTILALFASVFIVGVAASLAALLALNSRLYRFFHRERGFTFMVASLPLHVLYFLSCGAGFLYGCVTPATESSLGHPKK
jgi:hypothetical protein